MQSRLILFPDNPFLQIHPEQIAVFLTEMGLFGDLLDSAEFAPFSFQSGEKLLDFFSFLGCSPSIQFEPSAEKSSFCFFQIETDQNPQWIAGKNLKARCPACKKILHDAKLVAGSEDSKHAENVELLCEKCGAKTPINQISLRKTAVIAATRISLWDVYEGEVVPADSLLNQLQKQTGIAWKYSYVLEG